jgi:enterochelin esterase family protein
MKRRTLVMLAGMALPAVWAQTQQPRVISPEVHADRRVTFRLRAPNAKEVVLARETAAARLPMTKGDQGVWTVTTEALEPDLYGYSFVADGVSLIDPGNPLMKPNLLSTQSMVHVPGPATLPWEVNDVPHGAVHRHFYKSGIVGDHRDYYVYTPPGYDAKKRAYPTLYLLHGFSDDASGWTAVGRAHVILDNLIAQGKAKPMLVVMPLGYGAPEVVSRSGPGLRDRGAWQRNVDKFRETVVNELIPQIEKTYNVSKNRQERAIAGLSMGGTESLVTGLNHLDRFAWIGAFSSGGLPEDYAASFPAAEAKAAGQLRLLWITCGKDDRLIQSNHKFMDFLKSKGVKYTWTETAGAHTWPVWRRALADFTVLLFQDKTS